MATTYQFSVQYHAWATVEVRAKADWPMDMDGSVTLFRMLVEQGSDRHSDDSCAVFVPAQYDAHAAGLLFVAFTAAHPGVVPREVRFDFVAHRWWQRTPRSVPVPLVPPPRPQLQNAFQSLSPMAE